MNNRTGIWLGLGLWAMGTFLPGYWGMLLTFPGGMLVGWYGMKAFVEFRARKLRVTDREINRIDREFRYMWGDHP